MTSKVHYSSKTALWSTPQWLIDLVKDEFSIALDVCALPSDAKCRRFITPKQDGLKTPWRTRVGECAWMNPPYVRYVIDKWVERAKLAVYQYHWTDYVVALLPARTDTVWWHKHVADQGEIRFIKGRLKFGGAKTSAPFPSALVIYGKPANVIWWDAQSKQEISY